jgi:hypothetical protein
MKPKQKRLLIKKQAAAKAAEATKRKPKPLAKRKKIEKKQRLFTKPQRLKRKPQQRKSLLLGDPPRSNRRFPFLETIYS